MTPAQKEWIDRASLEDLLRVWRFAETGEPLLASETGDYFSKRMCALRDADHAGWMRASKWVGWDR